MTYRADAFITQQSEKSEEGPQNCRPYVKAQKNDDRDAEAIAEAATPPTMRFLEIKSEAQLDMQTLHRARERLVAERTALINLVQSVLLERGIAVAQGRCKLENQLPGILADEASGAKRPRPRQALEIQSYQLRPPRRGGQSCSGPVIRLAG